MTKMQRGVAVTGIGITSPLGHNTTATWRALMAKERAIDTISHFDASGFPSRMAAEVKGFDAQQRLPGKFRKYCASFTAFALAAADEAMDDAGIKPTQQDRDGWGLVVGAGMMTAEHGYWERFQQHFEVNDNVDWRHYAKAFDDFYAPHDFGKTVANAGLALLEQQHDIGGRCLSLHTACASGGQALGLGLQLIRRGQAQRVLVGGFDSMINPMGVSSFCLLGALSSYNDDPASASRPFDGKRDGFVLGEGAAFLVLERKDLAVQRKAKIYALLSGEGNTLSSYRITDSPPDGDGASQAIAMALRDAQVTAQDVDYINAHGTGTQMNDLSETNAIKQVLGERSLQIPVSSTKSQTGHLIAAAGALEGAFTALSIYHQRIPITMNLSEPDPQCNLDYVTDDVREATLKVALSNSFGFGGSNSCLLFKHAEEPF